MAGHPTDEFVHAHRDWVCGRDGRPCRFGPDRGGRCSMRPECAPVRSGDRWLCNRPMGRGGPCEKGPSPSGACCLAPVPCVPAATPRRRLKTAWRLAALLAFAAVLATLSTGSGLNPGPLSSSHAAFERDCAACHSEIEHPSLAWAATVFEEGRALRNAGKCLDCHRLGAAALAAHGVEDLPEGVRPDGLRPPPFLSRIAALTVDGRPVSPDGSGEIACTVCHREHGGREVRLPVLTDVQCQVCHRAPFDGFAGHPRFTSYPHHDASLVSFDHSSHLLRHFESAGEDGIAAPDGCSGCHRADAGGGMAVAGFAACASCHEGDIAGPDAAPDSSLEFLAPPGLDLEALAGMGIGGWPEYAEAWPNEFLMLMLDAGGYLPPEDLETLAELDLLDLVEAGAEEIEAAARLAWGFKALVRDLVAEGPGIFVAGARKLHPGAGLAPVWEDLAASLPYEVARAAADAWFPGLAEEMARFESGEPVSTRPIDLPFDPPVPEEWSRFGGWRLRDLALHYRPAGHADRFLTGWLTFASAPAPRAEALFATLAGEDAPGACAQCHVVESGGVRRLHWAARGGPRFVHAGAGAGTAGRGHLKPFSHFSHQQAIAEGGCVSCHEVAEEPSERTGPAGFLDLSRESCAACHRAENRLAGCVACHHYHFGGFGDDMLRERGEFDAVSPFGAAPDGRPAAP